MVEIIFQNKEDANKLFSTLHEKMPLDEDVILFPERQTIRLNMNLLDGKIRSQVIEIFYDFIIKIKREEWLRKILLEQFYFEDVDEQQAIIDIIYSIIDGKNEELLLLLEEDASEVCLVKEAISDLLQDTKIAFSFEAFVKFRLRSFFDKLVKYVEISIDEYKMEQEYQMFLQALRQFLSERQAKMDTLHLVHDEEILFFTERFEEIKRSELAKMIDRKLLSNHPVYVDSATIAPLLSVAPRRIFLYTNNQENLLVRTILNIFEERVNIMPVQLFQEA